MATDLQVKPIDEIDVSGLSCEDCPETNPNPPERSDCEYFDGSIQPPVCIRENSLGQQITGFLVNLG